jgi:hypothetical protein
VSTVEAGRTAVVWGTRTRNARRIAATSVGAAAVVASLVLGGGAANAATPDSYTAGTPQVAGIVDGSSAAPWNTSQGDPTAGAAYAATAPGTLLPTYTPGGSTTGSGAAAEPNLAVYPASGSDADVAAPSGVVGTPGPLDGYCESGTPASQPQGETLPFSPAYFPHVVRNADGSLTGYFDERPKDADESIVAATSTDNGKTWTYQGQALEQNPGYCPTADINDDGQGHPNVLTVGGTSRLYTLQRPAGDNAGVGMLVHTLTPTVNNPLAGLPASEKVGVDPDDFAAGAVALGTTPATIALADPVGTGPQQLVAGGFVDLTATPVPTPADVITCTGIAPSSLTGCTGSISVGNGDLIEQVVGTAGSAATVPVGPNNASGTGGLAVLDVNFANPTTASILNANAPNRIYVDGVAVYCAQSNASPTTEVEDCTTGPGGSALNVASGDPITADPVVPATAQVTAGLVSPDGIVGVLPSYPAAAGQTVPGGVTYVAYTEKILDYYIAGVITTGSGTFGSISTINFFPSASTAAVLPASGSFSVHLGDLTLANGGTDVAVPVTCTGWSTGGAASKGLPTDNLTGCSAPAQYASDSYDKKAWIGAPGAALVDGNTLAQTGEGSVSNAQKLFKNNEDLTVLRVAYTTDGINFSDAGLANDGIISGASNGASSYSDINDPSSDVSPANLNAYATPGTADATEMRFVGSAGTIITNPDGSYAMFLSGAWAGDGDSDAFNQIFYTTSTDGEHWSIPTSVVSTDYTFSASVAQDKALASGSDEPLGVSAYYSGRAYGPSVVANPDGTLTMIFAGYRLPSPIGTEGDVVGTDLASQYTIGATDPALYRNVLTVTLTPTSSTGPPTTVPESPAAIFLPLAAVAGLGAAAVVTRRRRRRA